MALRGTSVRILCPALIGREAQLEQLDERLREVMSGASRTILIQGEAGVGKSALLTEFRSRALHAGAHVLTGECSEIEVRRPFGPFVEVLRAAFRAFRRERVESSIERSARDLTRLMPERFGGRIVDSMPDTAERYRIHVAFVALMRELSEIDPLVVTIEDLHWGDEQSLELFLYLTRKLRDVPVLLIGTCRSDEPRRDHPLTRMLADISRIASAELMTLRPLNASQTGELIRASLALRTTCPQDLRKLVYERCEGNPLYSEEVLQTLAERGALVREGEGWKAPSHVIGVTVPSSVQASVQERMKGFSNDARRLLRIAAVIGRRFDDELLRVVASVPNHVLMESLHAAIDSAILERAEGYDSAYTFRHSLTRDAIYAELLDRERRELHAAVGAALEHRKPDDPADFAEPLSYHFDEAGDTTRALRYHKIAAKEALRLYAFERSARHIDRALFLGTPADVVELQVDLVLISMHMGDLIRGLQVAESARRQLEQANDRRRLGNLTNVMASLQGSLGNRHESRRLREEALAMLEPLGESAELADVYAALCNLNVSDGRFTEAIAWGERARDMSERLTVIGYRGREGKLAMALNFLGRAFIEVGRVQEAVAMMRRSIDLTREFQRPQGTQVFLNNLIWALKGVPGTAEQRRALVAETRAEADLHQIRPDFFLEREALLSLVDGDWVRCQELVAELSEERPSSIVTSVAQLYIAFIHVARNGPPIPPQITALSERLSQLPSARAGPLCRLMHLAGDDRACLDAAASAAMTPEGSQRRAVASALCCAIASARRLGDGTEVRRWSELALELAGGVAPVLRGLSAFARAELLVEAGDREGAAAELGRAAGHFAELPDQYAEHLSRLRRIELLAPGTATQTEFEQLLRFWERVGATWYLGQLREWATGHQLTFPRGLIPARRRGRTRLTTREREIAALLAHGLTNREIAERLSIAERTAEGHVERIRGKLGARSRAEVAAWVASRSNSDAVLDRAQVD